VRRKARTDSNHAEIVKFFRKVPGCAVLDLSRVGGGCPDILICHRQVLSLIEIKDGQLSPSRKKLTSDQQNFHQSWPGPIYIIESTHAASTLLGL